LRIEKPEIIKNTSSVGIEIIKKRKWLIVLNLEKALLRKKLN
jgi:hypothetical protein